MGQLLSASCPARCPPRSSTSKASAEGILSAAPKVELHVHLDGSFDTAILFQAAKDHLDELPDAVFTPYNGRTLNVKQEIKDCDGRIEKFKTLVTQGDDKGLFAMLDVFYRFLPLVRGRFDVLEELAYAFCKRQAEQNVVYTEVRYSPHEFVPQDASGKVIAGEATPAGAIRAVCRGLERGQADFGIVVRQILCGIGGQPSWAAEVVALAGEFRTSGVVGVDIAAGEMHFDDEANGKAQRSAMAEAAKSGFGVTIHAGEGAPPRNVAAAIKSYGADRIGHGYTALGTDAQQLAIEQGTHFELCPTSSLQTQAVDLGGEGWTAHPARAYCKQRTSCSIHSDDPVIFHTSLTNELLICVRDMGLSLSDIAWMTLEAIRCSFNLEDSQKASLEATVRTYYEKHGIRPEA